MTPGAGGSWSILNGKVWRFWTISFWTVFAFLPFDHSCCWSWSRIRNWTDLRKLLLFCKIHIYHPPLHHRGEDFKKDLQAYSFQNAMNIFCAHWGNDRWVIISQNFFLCCKSSYIFTHSQNTKKISSLKRS